MYVTEGLRPGTCIATPGADGGERLALVPVSDEFRSARTTAVSAEMFLMTTMNSSPPIRAQVIRSAGVRSQESAEVLQQLVTLAVAVGVVDGLEAVDIEDDDGIVFCQLVKKLIAEAAVSEPGQVVGLIGDAEQFKGLGLLGAPSMRGGGLAGYDFGDHDREQQGPG